MIDQSGQQVGSYRLMRRLGIGGFASVYLGQHVRIATKQAAIKLLYLLDVDSKKFQQEAETTAALEHPNIIHLIDFDFHDQMPFLVMDYAPGGSLRSRHPAGTLISLVTVVQYVQEIAKALTYAHSKNVIHCDIKPDNILIGAQGELRLSDFGIAVMSQTGHSTLTASSGVGGTAYYMAPEQIRGKPEEASDQYALAIMVYEWLCGKPPFSEGSAINIQYQHAFEPIPSLIERLPMLPPAVEQVILRALAKDPRERFATIQVFAAALVGASTLQSSSSTLPSLTLPPVQKKSLGTLLITCTGHTGSVKSVAWSPDGNRLASASRDETVRLWDARSGQLLQTYRDHATVVGSVVWSLDGRRVFIASASDDGTVQLWDVHSGQLLHTCVGHTDWVRSMAWSPDGNRLASASDDATVRLWNAHSGELCSTCMGHTSYVWSVAWSPDSKRVASASSDKTVRLWDAEAGAFMHVCVGHVSDINDVAWSPDGQHVVSASRDKTLRLWDAHSGVPLHTCIGHTANVTSVAWSPDGQYLASASDDKTVRFWNADTGELLYTCMGHASDVNDVAWSPDGSCVASVSWDKTVRLWQG